MYFKNPGSFILVLTQLILIFSLLSAGPVYPTNPLSFLFIVSGLVLGIWSYWTMHTVGKFNAFPEVIAGARLITVGPYKILRHPLYSAILIFGLGLFLNDFSLLHLFFLALLSVVLIYKIRSEEYYLSQFFPHYKDYAKTTYRLIPFVY